MDLNKKKKPNFRVGEKILFRTTNLQVNNLTLFQPRYIGPFEKVKMYGSNAVLLNKLENNKISKVYNMINIRKYIKPFEWVPREINKKKDSL
jgi:signal peptidase I